MGFHSCIQTTAAGVRSFCTSLISLPLPDTLCGDRELPWERWGWCEALTNEIKPRFLLLLILAPKQSCFLDWILELFWAEKGTWQPDASGKHSPRTLVETKEGTSRTPAGGTVPRGHCDAVLLWPGQGGEHSCLRAWLWQGISHGIWKPPWSVWLSSLQLGSRSRSLDKRGAGNGNVSFYFTFATLLKAMKFFIEN